MDTYSTAKILRSKKLGVLIMDARLAVDKTTIECAKAIGVSTETFEAFEFGEQSPSLPQVEVLACFLNIPIGHFWGNYAISENGAGKKETNYALLLNLRQKIIGVLLRQVRENAGLTIEALSESAGFSAQVLESFELGESAMSLPDLEILSRVLGQPLEVFQDKDGPVGIKIFRQRMVQDFLELDPGLQDFVCKPINRPYLDLAIRLSEMSVDKLRGVAEGLLEITL
jgi:transcriptional regulator with XRE-family HTH domain